MEISIIKYYTHCNITINIITTEIVVRQVQYVKGTYTMLRLCIEFEYIEQATSIVVHAYLHYKSKYVCTVRTFETTLVGFCASPSGPGS